MTAVSDLAKQASSWTPLLPVLGAIAAALTGGLMAIVGGLFGAWANQHLTRRREDRARIIQQRREVCVNAYNAYREFYLNYTERLMAAATVDQLQEISERLSGMLEAIEEQEQTVIADRTPEPREYEKERIKRHRADVERAELAFHKALDEKGKLDALEMSGALNLHYWALMLDITCSSGVAETYRTLIYSTDETRVEAVENFGRAMKEELNREPRLPGLLTPLPGLDNRGS